MTQEDKDLMLKDLCARLPYGVKCCIYNFGEDTIRIKEDIFWSVQGDNILTLKSCVEKGEAYMYHQIKPYLFPLSSMTEEQKKTLKVLCDWNDEEADAQSILVLYQKHFVMKTDVIDWLNENHFDYRGLIEKGLALDATGLNVY